MADSVVLKMKVRKKAECKNGWHFECSCLLHKSEYVLIISWQQLAGTGWLAYQISCLELFLQYLLVCNAGTVYLLLAGDIGWMNIVCWLANWFDIVWYYLLAD